MPNNRPGYRTFSAIHFDYKRNILYLISWLTLINQHILKEVCQMLYILGFALRRNQEVYPGIEFPGIDDVWSRLEN